MLRSRLLVLLLGPLLLVAYDGRLRPTSTGQANIVLHVGTVYRATLPIVESSIDLLTRQGSIPVQIFTNSRSTYTVTILDPGLLRARWDTGRVMVTVPKEAPVGTYTVVILVAP